MKKIRKKFIKLKKEIQYHNYLYHTLNSPKISNAKYDKMLQKLKKIETNYPNWITNNSPSQTIGSKPLHNLQSIFHKKPMLSLENIFNINEYLKFDKKIRNYIKEEKIEFCCEPKIDGLAINLIYKNKKLFQASTRGNGKIGENVTKNVQAIKSIPKLLKGKNIPKYIEIRGEIFIKYNNFQKINNEAKLNNKKIFSNPRNAAVGSLKQIDPKVTKKRLLSFFCYGFGEVYGGKLPSNQYSCLIKFKSWGLPICKNIIICKNNSEVLKFYKKMQNHNLNFEIDGIVIKVNSIKIQDKIGFTNRSPKWAIAFKFPDKQKKTTVNNIEFQIGRTGLITPVARLNPVQISGVIIKNCTLHNLNEINRLNINIGDTVLVCRSGGVIPKIIKNISKNSKKKKNTFILNNCPKCQSPIQKETEKGLIYCTGDLICLDQIKAKIKHFVSKKAMNIIGMGKNIINQLVDKKILKYPYEIYYLNHNLLKKIDGIQKKKSEKIIKSIEKSKKVTLSNFIYALGIPEVGEISANILANYYFFLNNFIHTNLKSLKKIKKIGSKTAKKIFLFLNEKKNQKNINELTQKIKIINTNNIQKNIFFKNKKIVLTGKIQKINRNELKKILILNNAKIMSKVTKKTDLIILGKNPGSNFFSALNLKIKIIKEKKLIKLLKL